MTSSGRTMCPCHCPRSQDGDLYGAWCPFPLSPSLDSWFQTPQVRLDSPQASGDGARAVRGRSRSVERLRPTVLDARHTAVPPAGGSCPALRPDPGRCVRDLLEASGLSPGLALSDRPAPVCRPSPGQPGVWLVESVHGVPRRHWGDHPVAVRPGRSAAEFVRAPRTLSQTLCARPADPRRTGIETAGGAVATFAARLGPLGPGFVCRGARAPTPRRPRLLLRDHLPAARPPGTAAWSPSRPLLPAWLRLRVWSGLLAGRGRGDFIPLIGASKPLTLNVTAVAAAFQCAAWRLASRFSPPVFLDVSLALPVSFGYCALSEFHFLSLHCRSVSRAGFYFFAVTLGFTTRVVGWRGCAPRHALLRGAQNAPRAVPSPSAADDTFSSPRRGVVSLVTQVRFLPLKSVGSVPAGS